MARPRPIKTKAPQRLIAYARVSTDEQGESGLSLAAQQEKLRAYATLYGIELVEVLLETGSARTLERPKLQQALEAIKRGRLDGILVVRLDRLTRSVRDLGELLEGPFAPGRGSLVSVDERLDTSTASGRLVVHVLIAVAEWERGIIGERTSAALRELRRQGRHTGGDAPFGFRIGKDGKLTPVAREQRTIQRARELRAEGLTQAAIAEALLTEGFRPRKGRRFYQAQVARMLRDVATDTPLSSDGGV